MSSILDSILGGGGASADPSGGSIPPDVMSAISAGGQGDPGAPGADQGDPNASAADLLSQILDLGTQYLQVEPDEQDKATVQGCLATLQKIRAKDQSEADGALQGKTTPRLIRKAMAGQGGGQDTSGGSGY